LAGWLAEREITFFHTVPTVFRHLTDTLEAAHLFPRLRLIQLGGESMFAKDVQRFKDRIGGDCVLTVGMGTSETGRLFEIGFDKSTECLTDVLPAGYPVEDFEVLLVDAHGQRVQAGDVGEIAVRGSFVSPGYWRRPELTATRFRPDPDHPEARLYLTGDLGCMLPDGCVFHLGRTDSRLRIRGQSVEIPEVEAALLRIAGVSEAVAAGEVDARGDLHLVAYIVPGSGSSLTASVLHRAMSGMVPGYMVPSAFVLLNALPLLPNGKVNRRALPSTGLAAVHDRSFVAPRTQVERKLAKVWARVLGVERVGVTDNFFELGGHSLLTMRVCTEVEKAFGRPLAPTALLHAPTVEELASLLEEGQPSPSIPSLVALQPNGSKPPFFWVHGENSNAFLPRFLGPDQPLYGLLQQSRDGMRARFTTIEDIAAYYLRGLRSVQPSGPYFLGGYCIGGILAFEMAQQLRRQAEDVALLVLLDPPPTGHGRSRAQRRDSSGSVRDAFRSNGWGHRQFRNLSKLAPQEKVAYIWDGVVSRTREQLARLANAATKTAGGLYIISKIPPGVSVSLRSRYINAVHGRAKRRYAPSAYPGRMVVLRTEEGALDLATVWGRLAAGGLEIHDVRGRHAEIVFDREQIQVLATHLKACLDKAQVT
jgi:thioesterase domain-containing protein/acyl carrier protein